MDVPGKLMLAPMAGITDAAFRSLCAEYGADMTVSELVSSHAILRENPDTDTILQRGDDASHFSIQIFGSDPEHIARAAQKIESRCDSIDINMGCPARKVWRSGGGSSLLKDLTKIETLVHSVASSVSIPVSVKIRTGISDSTSATAIAQACERGGASWITVHGRTHSQGYAGHADWSVIENVASSVSIPVIGNGDLASPHEVRSALDSYNVSGVAIGRGASGNPWIFSQSKTLLKGNPLTAPPSRYDRRLFFSTYLSHAQAFSIPFLNAKIQAQHLVKGLPQAASVRRSISKTRSFETLSSVMDEFLKE